MMLVQVHVLAFVYPTLARAHTHTHTHMHEHTPLGGRTEGAAQIFLAESLPSIFVFLVIHGCFASSIASVHATK